MSNRQQRGCPAPADARPADTTAQAPRPAPHSPPLALHGSLCCPRGRAGAALAVGHRPQVAKRDGLRAAHSITAAASKHPARQAGACGGFRGPAQRSDARPAGCAPDGRTDRGRQGCALRSARRVACRTATGPSPPQAPGLSRRGCCSGCVLACHGGVLRRARPGLPERGIRPRPRACRRATCGRDGSGSASRCAFAAARPPWLASLSIRPRWRGARWRASAAGCEARRAACCSLHHRRSLEAPRKAGWGLAADFESQPGDQTAGPQGVPRTGAPTEGDRDAPFGRPVGFLAAQQPARVRRGPPACRGEGAALLAFRPAGTRRPREHLRETLS